MPTPRSHPSKEPSQILEQTLLESRKITVRLVALSSMSLPFSWIPMTSLTGDRMEASSQSALSDLNRPVTLVLEIFSGGGASGLEARSAFKEVCFVSVAGLTAGVTSFPSPVFSSPSEGASAINRTAWPACQSPSAASSVRPPWRCRAASSGGRWPIFSISRPCGVPPWRSSPW